MWSDKYNYYNIQSDNQFSQKVEIKTIVDILLQTNLLVQKNHQSFTNSKSFPWVDIIIVQATNGDFAATDKPLSHVNLIAIVCSKGNEINQTIYKQTFLNIAAKLNWKLFLEADDEGNENIEVKHA